MVEENATEEQRQKEAHTTTKVTNLFQGRKRRTLHHPSTQISRCRRYAANDLDGAEAVEAHLQNHLLQSQGQHQTSVRVRGGCRPTLVHACL